MAPLSSLFCTEQPLNTTKAKEESQKHNKNERNSISFDYLSSLITNQHKTNDFSSTSTSPTNIYLHFARKQSVEWIKTASRSLKFNASTVLLAVSYLDRCFLIPNGFCLKQDKPWMSQLAAIACLSLAAKLEESYVPLLLDIQLSSGPVSSFVFDSKTVRRMELLVLSTLSWRMGFATSLSFVQCLLSISDICNGNELEIVRRCECLLLDALTDSRWLQYSPAVWAAAAMQHAVGKNLDEMYNIFNQLEVSKETVHECYGIILEVTGSGSNKRKTMCHSEPQSPIEVIGSCFSFENTSIISSSHEPPPPKRSNWTII